MMFIIIKPKAIKSNVKVNQLKKVSNKKNSKKELKSSQNYMV